MDAISSVQTKESEQGDSEIFIIGGASVYSQAMPFADRLCLTLVHDVADKADAFFPPIDDWKEVSREDHDTDEKHNYKYSFVDFERKVPLPRYRLL
jgi:dihydrofolate reductase